MPLPEFYTLDQVAERFGWSRLKLIRRLKSYRIAALGSGKEARLTDAEVNRLLDHERSRAEWEALPREEKRRRRREFTREFREEYNKKKWQELQALLPPVDPEMQASINKALERHRQNRAARARRKLMRELGLVETKPTKKS